MYVLLTRRVNNLLLLGGTIIRKEIFLPQFIIKMWIKFHGLTSLSSHSNNHYVFSSPDVP